MPGVAAITGAYGYLGGVIRALLEARGWETVAFVRTPRAGDRAVAWRLADETPEQALGGVDVLVHCAYDFGSVREDDIWDVNVRGTEQLLDAAAGAGVARVLVVSSMSAYPGTTQIYGRAKLAIEALALARGGIAVRPGLVYGPDPGGIAGAILRVAGLPVVPVIAPRARQFPVHQDDLARSIARILEAPEWHPEIIGIAQPQAMPFADVIRALAALRGRSPWICPVPWQIAHRALRLAEAAHVDLGFRSDSILGLVRTGASVPRSEAFPDLLESLRELTPEAARS